MSLLSYPAGRGLIVAGAIVALQAAVYWPSLIGSKLLLPLDLLARPGVYIPGADPGGTSPVFLDAVTHWELARQFAAREVRAGRLPVWDPYNYAGAPFADFGKYSPYTAVRYLFPSPRAVAWVQVLKALVAGGGFYLFARRVVAARFWPAALTAACYPVSVFYLAWGHDPISDVVTWYPLLLVGVHLAVRRPVGWGAPVTAVATAGAVLAGHADIAGQVLLGSGLFAVWSLARRYRLRPPGRPAAVAAGAVAVGWAAGLMLSAPYLLPLAEYVGTGQRMEIRRKGAEERPPGGLSALPQVFCPEWFGSHRPGAAYVSETSGNLPESAGAAAAGVLAALVAAPLAWADRRRRGLNWFLAGTAVLGVAWTLGLPLVVSVLRLPGLNMMSHNRLTFLTGFATLALAAAGLSTAWRGGVRPRGWFLLPALGLGVLSAAAVVRAGEPPPEFAQVLRDLPNAAQVGKAQADRLLGFAGVCLAGVAAWAAAGSGRVAVGWPRLLAAALVAEALLFADGYIPQADPGRYYPALPVLEAVRAAGPTRVTGVGCFPASLLMSHELRDVRGYDAIDPRPTLDVLELARDQSDRSPSYARTQTFLPKIYRTPGGAFRVHPVLDMLGVRHLVAPSGLKLPFELAWAGEGYAVYVNPHAAARAFVPDRVEFRADGPTTLRYIADPGFELNRVAVVNVPLTLPAESRGAARVSAEEPARVAVEADMETAGLVVLADQWASGWAAEIDGQPAALVRTNHALKGVVVPAGRHTVVFTYRPPGLRSGLACLGAGLGVLLVWPAIGSRLARGVRAPAAPG